MARNQIILRPGPTPVYRRQQQLLRPSRSTGSITAGGRVAEVAGGTAAECAAVFCCCPCTVVNLLVLAVYKLPAGICRKAIRRRRRRQMLKKGLLPLPSSVPSSAASSIHHHRCGGCGWDEDGFYHQHSSSAAAALDGVDEDEEVAVVVVDGSDIDQDLRELENEMWQKFYSSGFWRSSSHREEEEEEEQH